MLGKVIATATGPGVATARGERQSGDHCNNVRTVSGDPHYYYHYHLHQFTCHEYYYQILVDGRSVKLQFGLQEEEAGGGVR